MKNVNFMILAIATLMLESCGTNTKSNVTAESRGTDSCIEAPINGTIYSNERPSIYRLLVT